MNDAPIKSAPAFDFYPERWTHGTRHLSKIERCDYLDLLCHQWTEDGLTDNLELIARLLGYVSPDGSPEIGRIPSLVLEKFPVADDGKRRNARLEELRTKQLERMAKKRAGADKTNEKKRREQQEKGAPPPDKPADTPKVEEPETLLLKGAESPKPMNPLQERVGRWFGRKPTTKWSEKELRAWDKIRLDADELDMMEVYYAAEIPEKKDIRRKDLATLLNNWNGELDRARKFQPTDGSF